MSGFIGELAPAALLEANSRGIRLPVVPVDAGLVVEADRQVLAAAGGNSLQNAFKFTRPRTTVTLRVGASAGRVLIEVQDECAGLPGGDVNEMFRPFEQRSTDRTGMGLGLASADGASKRTTAASRHGRPGVVASGAESWSWARQVTERPREFQVARLPRPAVHPNS